MSTVALDVAAVRARFSALRSPLAFFDGPGGTQVPDEVIDAIGGASSSRGNWSSTASARSTWRSPTARCATSSGPTPARRAYGT